MKLTVGIAAVLVTGLWASHGPRAFLATGQKDPPARALLSGQVVESRANEPVPEVLVTLRKVQSQTVLGTAGTQQSAGTPAVIRQVTDAAGRFAFMRLTPGSYSLTASKLGYSEGAFGRRRPDGPHQPLSLQDGQLVGNLTIPLWKTASVAGTIRDESSEPIGRIPVRALRRILIAGRWAFVPTGTTMTDERGFYRIGSLIPDEYIIEVPSTQLSAPESLLELSKRLQTDPSGAVQRGWPELIAGNNILDLLAGGTGVTVDRVRLQPSFPTLVINAKPGLRPSTYPTRYFAAGRTADEATLLSLGVGDERLGLDLILNPVPAYGIAGTVKGPDGPEAVSLSLTNISESTSRTTPAEAAITFSDTDGRFLFPAVPAGEYRLQVAAVPERIRGDTGPIRPSLWLSAPISVGTTDVTDVALTLQHGFQATGRVDFESDAPRSPDLVRRTTLTVESADGRTLTPASITRIAIRPDGSFSTSRLPEGSYFIRVNGSPPGWFLTGIRLAGRDVSKVPLLLNRDLSQILVTFRDRGSELTGSVRNDAGLSDSDTTVAVFPTDGASWVDYGQTPPYIRSVRASSDGNYRILGLLSGDYFVVAVPEETAINWQDTKTLRALARLASRITVAENEMKVLNLRTATLHR